MKYARPALTVDAVILAGHGKEMQLLVIKRKGEPFAGQLALPGGFVNKFEAPGLALIRELREETSLELKEYLLVPLRLRTKEGRDPRGWTISQPYLAWLEQPEKVVGRDDAADAFWIRLENLSSLSFDHGAILCEGLSHFWNIFPTANFYAAWNVQGYGAPTVKNTSSVGTSQNRAIILYPGSFDPWHEGHSHCVRSGAKLGLLIVVPDWNPFKSGKDKDREKCAWRYYRQIQRNIADLVGENVWVYSGFCGLERPNPTFQWLNLLKGFSFSSSFSVEKFQFLMGDDSFVSLPQWIFPERFLSKLDKIYLVPRNQAGDKISQTLDWLKESHPSLEVVSLPDHPFKNYSSTEIRNE